MSDEQKVYDFYKGSIPLYLSISFFSLAPLWPSWSARLIWGGLGIAAIIVSWVRQSRQKLYFDNDSIKRQSVTKDYKISKPYQNLLLGAALVIAITASTIGLLKFGFGKYQFIGLSLSIIMCFMAITNLVYLPSMRRRYNLKK